MRWFKHMSNMRNHPVIKAARYKWGNEPYTFWCLLLELASESCGNNPEQAIAFDTHFLKKETMLSWAKIRKFLCFFEENSLLFWCNSDENSPENIEIKVLKLASIRDNHTKNLQVTGKSLAHKKEEEREKKKEIPPKSPKGESEAFKKFWDEYPKKVGKPAALSKWNTKQLDPRFDEIMDGLKVQKSSQQWLKDDGQFIPYPATFLNQERWLDQAPIVSPQAKAKTTAEIMTEAWKAGKSFIHKPGGKIVSCNSIELFNHRSQQVTEKDPTSFRSKATGDYVFFVEFEVIP